VDARHALYAAAKRKAEEMRVQIRKQHSLSLKRGKFEKHSVELEEVCVFEPFLRQGHSDLVIVPETH
jgi:hypothetical protein